MARDNVDDYTETLEQRKEALEQGIEKVLYNLTQIEEGELPRIAEGDPINLGGPSPRYIPIFRIDKYGQRIRINEKHLTQNVDNLLGILKEENQNPLSVNYATLLVRLKEKQKEAVRHDVAQSYAPVMA